MNLIYNFNNEELEFLREFKLLLIQGFVVKKICKWFYLFRTLKYNTDTDELCWNSNKKQTKFFKINQIVLQKNPVIENISKELLQKYLIIQYENQKMTIEFFNNYSCELFYDGMNLLISEMKNKNIRLQNKRFRQRTLLKKILIEQQHENDENDEND